MVKPKQKQLVAKPATKISAQSGLVDFSGPKFDADLHGEDGWVMVRKQRVTILVPSLPIPEKFTMQKSAPSESQTEPINHVDTRPVSPIKAVETQQECPTETSPVIASVDKEEKVAIPNFGKDSQIATTKVAKRPRKEFRGEPENPVRVGTLKLHKVHRMPYASKTVKYPRMMCGPRDLDGNLLLNQRLRAINIEKKLQRAGGLSMWLASIGLGQFERIFQGKRISKFQLVNLTMEKLKEMGAVAVGPRRKLIHAIDCVCHPFCFAAQ